MEKNNYRLEICPSTYTMGISSEWVNEHGTRQAVVMRFNIPTPELLRMVSAVDRYKEEIMNADKKMQAVRGSKGAE